MIRFTFCILRFRAKGAFFIFVAALLPRLYALGSFLTIDEVKWAEGAAQFLLALHSGDLFQTYWHFFPGITISWGGALALGGLCLPALDLTQCAQAQVENLGESIGWLRLSPVLLSSLGVVGVYSLGRKLFTEKVALLAALLLAFDPFFIAHSRILNGDAGAAMLMFLSLLAFLIYGLPGSTQAGPENQPGNALDQPETTAQQTPQQPLHPPPPTSHLPSPTSHLPSSFLLLSGVLAGLAWLTKLPAPLIGVFVVGLGFAALMLAWRQAGWRAARRWIGALVIWGGVAGLTCVVLWPALWVAPVQTLWQMYIDTFEVGEAGAGHDTFFLGQILDDPGPWFYPYTVAFRLTPVVLIGLLLTIGWLLLCVKCHVSRVTCHHDDAQLETRNSQLLTTWILLIYILFIIICANASPKKLDRYIMGVIPPLIFLAALGWTKMIEAGLARLPFHLSNRQDATQAPTHHRTYASFILLSGLLALQLIFAIFAAPYYLTYYNPLLGGVQRAVAQVPAGWGEGLEQAALYLNHLPEAESLTVSSWYGDIFHPYFVGQPASFSDDGRAQLAADYVVFYINQIQRQKPDPGLVDYFRATAPVFVVAIGSTGKMTNQGGVPWVEVYKAPAAQSASGAPKVEGVAQLLAYKVIGSRVGGEDGRMGEGGEGLTEPLTADEIMVMLFLRVLGPLPEGATLAVGLVPFSSGQILDSQTQYPERGSWHPIQIKGEWLEGQIVEWPGVVTLPAATPPGEYRLWVALQAKDGQVLVDLPISEKDPPVRLE